MDPLKIRVLRVSKRKIKKSAPLRYEPSQVKYISWQDKSKGEIKP